MESLMKYIGRLNRLAILYRSMELEAEGINGIQHSYILRVCAQPGITQDELAQALPVHKSNVARQLALLEEGGYVTRVPKEGDKRALKVFPTDKMLSVYPKVRRVLDEWDACLVEDFTRQQREALAGMLVQMLDRAARRVAEARRLML